MSRVQEIKDRLQLYEECCRRLGSPARIHGGVAQWRCPKHDERTPSFTVNLTGRWEGRWRCWGACDRGGDVIDLIAWLDGCSLGVAIERLSDQLRLGAYDPQPRRGSPSTPPPPRPVAPERRSSPARLPRIDKWLEDRGWMVEVAQLVGLEVVADWQGRARVRFPFRRLPGGTPVYYQDRAMAANVQPKWRSARGQTPCPFEAWRMRLARERRQVIICEGLPDVMAVLHHWPDAAVIGIPGATALKPSWARAFRGITDVYVVTDNDPAGQKMRERVNLTLEATVWPDDIHHLWVPGSFKDVDEWRKADSSHFPDAFLAALDSAREASHVRAGTTGRDLGADLGCSPCPPEEGVSAPELDISEGVACQGSPAAGMDRAGPLARRAHDPRCPTQDREELAGDELRHLHLASPAGTGFD